MDFEDFETIDSCLFDTKFYDIQRNGPEFDARRARLESLADSILADRQKNPWRGPTVKEALASGGLSNTAFLFQHYEEYFKPQDKAKINEGSRAGVSKKHFIDDPEPQFLAPENVHHRKILRLTQCPGTHDCTK